MAKKKGMNLNAVLGVLKSKKVNPKLKEGLRKKYEKQLKAKGLI